PVPAPLALEGDDLLARPRRRPGLGVVLEALHRLGLADVEVVLPEGETEGTVQPLDDLRLLVDLALAVGAAQHVDRPRAVARGVGDQDLAAGRSQHEAGDVEALRCRLDLEARGELELLSYG